MASIFDARSYRIPNQLIIFGYVTGLFLNIWRFNMIGIVYFIIAAIWPILLLYLLYHQKALGAGDIKLFSVASTYVGMEFLTDMMVASVMLAGVAILVLCIHEGRLIKRKLHYSFYITAAFFLVQLK